MSPSEAQKKAANKYIAANMATLGCKVRKAEAEAFRQYAQERGKTANAVLHEFIMDCINKDGKGLAHG